MNPLTYAYVAVSSFAHRRVEAMRKSDRGAPTIEYLGLAILVAGIIGVLVSWGFGDMIAGGIEDAINRVLPGGDGGGGGGGGGGNDSGSGARPNDGPNDGHGVEAR